MTLQDHSDKSKFINSCADHRLGHSYLIVCLDLRKRTRGHSTKFYTGRLRSEVQLLTLLYTIFDRKGTPLAANTFH